MQYIDTAPEPLGHERTRQRHERNGVFTSGSMAWCAVATLATATVLSRVAQSESTRGTRGARWVALCQIDFRAKGFKEEMVGADGASLVG